MCYINMYWPSEYRLFVLQKYRSSLTNIDLGLSDQEFEKLMREDLEAEKKRKRKLEANELGMSLEAYDELLQESERIEADRRRHRRVNVGAEGDTRHTQRNVVSSSSTPLLQAYMCPILGDHIIIFTTFNSITRMFYKSHGRSGLQTGAQRIFDLFTNIWFESKGFSAVSSGSPHTRTIQKYSWSDDFLLGENFEQNSRFFVDKIVYILIYVYICLCIFLFFV